MSSDSSNDALAYHSDVEFEDDNDLAPVLVDIIVADHDPDSIVMVETDSDTSTEDGDEVICVCGHMWVRDENGHYARMTNGVMTWYF